MTQQETDRRNEAIALFDGWIKPHPEWENRSLLFRAKNEFRHVSQFTYHRDWNALMPVVEKIRQSLKGKSSLEDESAAGGSCIHLRINYHSWAYYWYIEGGNCRDDFNGEFAKSCRVASYLEAYWLAVSDYCMSLTAPAGGGQTPMLDRLRAMAMNHADLPLLNRLSPILHISIDPETPNYVDFESYDSQQDCAFTKAELTALAGELMKIAEGMK